MHFQAERLGKSLFLIASETIDRLPQAQVHFNKLHTDQTMYKSMLDKLQKLPHSSLIIHGKYDPVLCEHQHDFVMKNVNNAQIITYDKSAHFPRIAEPDGYAEEVIQYIQGK
ncbi:alpha/beta hydrolase [Chengkuizengella sp. 2205SS18-9]|uniref:Alpha/beta hydrolase n=1 Tax=Chengkuizengella axinellae TaxID=3064388 RepID=A0ABT9J643_9BACL|nr:alpha/beta hydrolase [Chengkuizengella sp. 2205SS18-9]MDP5277091.1 alpha/beta hydrolase [Chengkuizengella sp. 2205SS18-9]